MLDEGEAWVITGLVTGFFRVATLIANCSARLLDTATVYLLGFTSFGLSLVTYGSSYSCFGFRFVFFTGLTARWE